MPHNICCTSRRNGLGRCSRRATVAVFRFCFVCLISRGLIATTLAILALTAALTGSLLQLVTPSDLFLIIAFIGSISAFIVASYALGYAALAPGVITVHRVLGAIALYLNLGLMFGTVYRLVWYFVPDSLTNIPAVIGWQAYGAILYFSFVTLTSIGFGDIAPVHPFVRMLTNLEAIIGQLYPATLLARLITLELRTHRQQPARSKRRVDGTRAPLASPQIVATPAEEAHASEQGHRRPTIPP
jgi:Ion channel